MILLHTSLYTHLRLPEFVMWWQKAAQAPVHWWSPQWLRSWAACQPAGSRSLSPASPTMPSKRGRDCMSSGTTERRPQGRDFRRCAGQTAWLWWIKSTEKTDGPSKDQVIKDTKGATLRDMRNKRTSLLPENHETHTFPNMKKKKIKPHTNSKFKTSCFVDWKEYTLKQKFF